MSKLISGYVANRWSNRWMIVLVLVLVCGSAFAQDCGVHHEWTRQYGGTYTDMISYLHVFPDGTYLAGGNFSDWFDPLHPELNPEPWGSFRTGVFGRFSPEGEVLWLKHFVGEAPPGVRYFKVLPDGRFLMCGHIYTATTFGYGEPNETVLPPHPTDGQGGFYVASYNADGTFAWARRFTCATTPTAAPWVNFDAVPDGSCHVLATTCGDNELAFDDGPVFSHAVVVARYSAEGDLDWVRVVQGTIGAKIVTSLPDSYLLVGGDWDRVEVTRYSEASAVLWQEQLPKPLYHVFDSLTAAIPDTSDFYLVLGDRGEDLVTVRRYNTEPGGDVTLAWTTQFEGTGRNDYVLKHDRSLYLYHSVLPPVCISPDGQITGETCDMFPLLPSEPYGSRTTLLIAFTAGDAGLLVSSHMASPVLCPVPIFGEGQDTETTFTVNGISDAALSKYLFVPKHSLQPQLSGHGYITCDPPGGNYTQGTLVTARAEPTWPDHDQFVRWDGDLAGFTEPEVTFAVSGAMSFTAVFEPLPDAPPMPAASVAALAALATALAGVAALRKR